jgi:hypothetical protein
MWSCVCTFFVPCPESAIMFTLIPPLLPLPLPLFTPLLPPSSLPRSSLTWTFQDVRPRLRLPLKLSSIDTPPLHDPERVG